MKSTAEVKADDMEGPTNGSTSLWRCRFWKTEMAIRAAFKAVDNSKQGCDFSLFKFLALPTLPHFTERLRGYACFYRSI
jgi:hypothetical protein